jgi:predicted TIM-barrel enzyme
VQREGTGALVCAHGGPIATAEDFAYVARRVPDLNGFFGASTFERIPIEMAVTAAVRAFSELEVTA